MSNPDPLDILAILSRDRSLALDTNSLFPRVEELKTRLQGVEDDIAAVTVNIDAAEGRLQAVQDALPPLRQGAPQGRNVFKILLRESNRSSGQPVKGIKKGDANISIPMCIENPL